MFNREWNVNGGGIPFYTITGYLFPDRRRRAIWGRDSSRFSRILTKILELHFLCDTELEEAQSTKTDARCHCHISLTDSL